ncbi:MAG: alcohol dehydrogenase catalytic domain-containing protein [Desulfobacterales bacterium]|nr:alcohol dehydrogenase catalytic domain-containing protein [Desulfobacterales bacterium]
MSHPETSIVIRTFNEEKYLPDLLDALRLQAQQDFETIVVDSGSWDQTREIAAQKADKLLPIESHDFTFGHSLNVGIEAAGGLYIAIASAHTLPLDAHWVGKLIEPLRDKKTAMVYGRQLGGRRSKFGEVQDMRRTFGERRKVMRPPRFFANNANSAIRKDLWQQRPFNANLLGLEDIEWAKYWMERDYRVIYEPEASLYHIHEENWRQIRRRYFREAAAARWIGIKNFWHALAAPCVESTRLFFDFGCIVTSPDQGAASFKNKTDLALETLLFRTNKTIGTVKGLMSRSIIENQNVRRDMFFDRTCQAVVIHGPKRASIDDISIQDPKPGEILIRVAYEGVCATDIEIYEGHLGYYKNGVAKYPIVPGHEFSGHVVGVGSNITHVTVGDAVVVECIQSCGTCQACLRENFIACQKRTELGVIGRNGGYAEYVVVPGRFAHPLPAEFDLKTACLCEPLAVALKGLKRFRRTWKAKKSPKKCAVVGAGALGHLCARVLAHWGHDVTVFDRNRSRLNYFADSDIHVSQDLSGLQAFENLLEVTGNPQALDAILNQSPAGARILLLGLPYAHQQYTFEGIVAYDKMLVGSVGSAARHFKMAIDLLPQIATSAFFDKVLPLSAFKTAWELAKSQQHLKIILEVG